MLKTMLIRFSPLRNAIAHEKDSWAQNRQELDRLTTTQDVVEGITAFLQKRDPTWTAQ